VATNVDGALCVPVDENAMRSRRAQPPGARREGVMRPIRSSSEEKVADSAASETLPAQAVPDGTDLQRRVRKQDCWGSSRSNVRRWASAVSCPTSRSPGANPRRSASGMLPEWRGDDSVALRRGVGGGRRDRPAHDACARSPPCDRMRPESRAIARSQGPASGSRDPRGRRG
jgi:hypothetical protein